MLSPKKKKLPLVFALSLRDTGESTSTLVSPTSAAFANDSYHMCNFMISFPDPNNCPSLLNMGQRWGHYWVRWGDTFAEGFSLQRRKFHTLLFETWELSEHDLKMQHLEALERNFFIFHNVKIYQKINASTIKHIKTHPIWDSHQPTSSFFSHHWCSNVGFRSPAKAFEPVRLRLRWCEASFGGRGEANSERRIDSWEENHSFKSFQIYTPW